MENKRKNEKLIFWGFVFLAVSFIGLIFYFQFQSSILNRKKIKLEIKETELNARIIEIEKLRSLISENKQAKADSISKETTEQIKSEINQINAENKIESIIYVQVGSEQAKSNLINLNFISTLNSKGYNVVNAYDLEDEKKVDNSIRYFNKEDKNLAEKLRLDIQKEFSLNLTVKYIKGYKISKGQVEIWVK